MKGSKSWAFMGCEAALYTKGFQIFGTLGLYPTLILHKSSKFESMVSIEAQIMQ
jgi:hypothetical protein